MIIKYSELNKPQKDQVEEIFFINSNKSFDSNDEQEEFKNKWLVPYIKNSNFFYVMLIDQEVVGYINGHKETRLENSDFSSLLIKFPAHLHINFSPKFQSKGYGSKLVNYFCDQLIDLSIVGIHLITSPTSSNVRFYQRNGFTFSKLSYCEKYLFMGRELNNL